MNSTEKSWMLLSFPAAGDTPKSLQDRENWSASDDGDFLILRNERQKRFEEEKRNQKKVGDLFNVLRSSIKNLSFEEENKKVDSTKTFLNAIQDGCQETVKNMISKQEIDLTKLIVDDESQQNALHYALEVNQVDIAQYFISILDKDFLCKTYNINVEKISGKKNALHRITEMKNVDLANVFLSQLDKEMQKTIILQEIPMAILGQRPRTLSCLHLAAYIDCNQLINLYLSKGVDVNSKNSKGDVPLLWAARWNNTQVMKTLLENGANPNIGNDKGSTALHWSVRYKHEEAVKILLANKETLVKSERKVGLVSPIILSSALGSLNITKHLLDAGADVNQKIRGDERPIHHAAKEGHEDIVELLIERGAYINEDDASGNTALFLAIKNDHPLSVHTLVMAGSDLCHKNRDGRDVWSYALANDSNKCLETLVYCIKKMINQTNETCPEAIKDLFKSRSPIFEAASINAVDKLRVLANMEVDLETKDHNMNSLHHYAALNKKHQVIREFANMVDINAKNKFGETPLHLACSIGCYETVKVLLDCKAKANLKNKLDRTALHTAAVSPKTGIDTMKLLMNYVMKSHMWSSLNEKDKTDSNAMHLAATNAKPEVIWECRFISCKDVDAEGNTPFHLAACSSQPEILCTLLKVYEFNNMDADIDAQNAKQETPLHLAALKGFKDNTEKLIHYGADLRKCDSDGNSVLHKLVEASIEDGPNKTRHLEMIDLIIDKAAISYCINKDLHYPDSDVSKLKQYRFDALMELFFDIKNNQNLSVLDLASKMAAKEAFEKLIMLEGVTKFNISSQVYFDITHLIPWTNNSLDGCCGRKKVKAQISCIKWLLTVEDPEQAAMVLDIPPLNVIEEMYAQTCRWVYFTLMVLHVIYMGLISYNSHNLVKKAQMMNETSIFILSDTENAIFFGITPIEPVITVLCFLLVIVRSDLIWNKSKKQLVSEVFSLQMIANIYSHYTPLCIMFLFSATTTLWMVFFITGLRYQEILISISLCIGWMICVMFTRGFKGIHHFWRMLRIMIFRDGMRFLFVYAFVLLSFSFSMHVLLNITRDETAFRTLFSTFNLMLGITDVFSDELMASLRDNLFFDLIYSVYIVLSTIILLNLLIAMMNDSYQAIQRHEALSWRISSMRLGLEVEKFIPFLTKISSRNKVKSRPCMMRGNITRWYVVIPTKELLKYKYPNKWTNGEKYLRNQFAIKQESR